MKVCYIVLTCDKNLDTRVKYQMETFLSDVDTNDIFYLTSKPNIEKRQFGWNCMDDDKNITWKYIHFIYNMKTILNYDWYLFIDDDTFVFIDRAKQFLSQYDHNDLYYIGNELDHIKHQFCLYMSGGAGYALSNGLYKLLYNYVQTTGINNSFLHWHSDLCIGLWIQQLKESHNIIQIDNKQFLIDPHKNESELNNAITIHRTMTEESNAFYYSIAKQFKEKKNTTFVIVTDLNYFKKAKRTIIDLRSRGNWREDIVVITIDFQLNANFKDFYNIIEVKFPTIDKSELLRKIGENGFSNSDKSEITKLNQWEKLHVFDDYFMKWNRVVFLDAGLRVLDDVKYLLEFEYKGKILAPRDAKLYEMQQFRHQLDFSKPELIDDLMHELEVDILDMDYMLNCMWVYDTNILKVCNKNQLIDAMNKYPFSKNNEMGIMNIMFHFKYKLWKRLPIKTSHNKFTFDWCEKHNPNTNWKDYCFIKYPVTISFDDC